MEQVVRNFAKFGIDRVIHDNASRAEDPASYDSEELEQLRSRLSTLIGSWLAERQQSGHIRQVSSFFSGPSVERPEEGEIEEGEAKDGDKDAMED